MLTEFCTLDIMIYWKTKTSQNCVLIVLNMKFLKSIYFCW